MHGVSFDEPNLHLSRYRKRDRLEGAWGGAIRGVQRIVSDDEKSFIEIVENPDGTYSMQRFAKKFDAEEAAEYVIRLTPNPEGRFSDPMVAASEARRLLEMKA